MMKLFCRRFSSKAIHSSQQRFLALEDKFGATNYHPIPIVLSRGEGIFLYDTDGRKYFDCLAAYSAVNQGHCHPEIVKTLREQAGKLTLVSRAFYHDILGEWEEFMCKTFGYQRCLPMNSGAEATETGVKLARRWAYDVKKVPQGQAKIVVAEGNFHGRTIAMISASDDPSSYGGFGPLLDGYVRVPYNDIKALERLFESDKTIAAFLLEPIQGEAGVNVPSPGYLEQVAKLCKKHNVLFIADEIQTGLGRTGTMLCTDRDKVRGDIVLLGKALSGGLYPVSAILASDEVMLTIKPGQHGSTFGGNPLGCAVSRRALEVLIDEKLVENSEKQGKLFRSLLEPLKSKTKRLKSIRGQGLMNAIIIEDGGEGKNAWSVCMEMAKRGILAKPTRGNIIRLTPPLVITEAQVRECVGLIGESIMALDK